MKYSLKAILLICVAGAYAPNVGSGPGSSASGSGSTPTAPSYFHRMHHSLKRLFSTCNRRAGSRPLLATDSANDKSKSSVSKPTILTVPEDWAVTRVFDYLEHKDLSKMRSINKIYRTQVNNHILPRVQNPSTVDEVLKWIPFVNLRMIVDKLKSFTDTPSDEQLDAVVALSMPEHSTPAELRALKSLIQFLLTAGADVNAEDTHGNTRLHFAACNGHAAVAQALLKYDKTNVNVKSPSGWTPLHLVANNGNVAVARLLLEKGANVNAPGQNGYTPLCIAAFYGRAAVARLLIDRGAHLNATTTGGRTPLYIAAERGHAAVVQLLINAGASVNAPNGFGNTPLYSAAQNGHVAVARLLLDRGADVNALEDNGRTPLYIASKFGHAAVARLFLANKANVNAPNKYCWTPLYIASKFGHEEVARLLRANGGI